MSEGRKWRTKRYSCPVCGDVFYADAGLWVYMVRTKTKRGEQYSRLPVCSFGCMNKGRREYAESKYQRGEKRSDSYEY